MCTVDSQAQCKQCVFERVADGVELVFKFLNETHVFVSDAIDTR